LLALAACGRPAEDRALAELSVGEAEAGGVAFAVEGGLACIRAIEPGAITLWAQAPALRIELAIAAQAETAWTITVENALFDAELTGATAIDVGGDHRTQRVWQVTLPPGGDVTLELAPSDLDDPAPWRFAALADIQTALPEVDEVFAAVNEVPDVRFVIVMGDLTQRGEPWEYEQLDEQLRSLDVPFYATLGNHELFGDADEWLRRFGRADVHFEFRGVAFSLIDSGNATIDPLVHDLLDGWLADDVDRIHVFATHYPLLDPIGARAAGFASRREAAALLQRLAAGNVDLTLYGHVHTHETFDNAGIPAHISGGGGADPMLLDGIDRHFLVVEVDPAGSTVTDVEVVRVDDPYEW